MYGSHTKRKVCPADSFILMRYVLTLKAEVVERSCALNSNSKHLEPIFVPKRIFDRFHN